MSDNEILKKYHPDSFNWNVETITHKEFIVLGKYNKIQIGMSPSTPDMIIFKSIYSNGIHFNTKGTSILGFVNAALMLYSIYLIFMAEWLILFCTIIGIIVLYKFIRSVHVTQVHDLMRSSEDFYNWMRENRLCSFKIEGHHY